MFACLIFWLALLIPGIVTARLVDCTDDECGLPGMLGLGYFWTFVILSPVSVVCYLARLPVFVFAGAVVLVVLASLILIAHRGWWRVLGRVVVTGLGIELLLVAVDLVFGARAGAFLSGDAEVHVARIRLILDHGFSNRGPYLDTETFFALYHTNLFHALEAACARLTGVDYLTVWSVSLLWVKLAIFGGYYYFAWSVLRSRWAAWIPALYKAAAVSPVPFVMYPNKIASLCLLPVAMAFAVQALRGPLKWPVPLKLAGASLVLGQIHVLYAFFAGLVIAPILMAQFVVRAIRRRGERKLLLICAAALLAGAPFVLASRFGGDRPARIVVEDNPSTPDEKEQSAKFHESESGWVSFKFSVFRKSDGIVRSGLLVAGLVGLVFLDRRREALVLAALAAIAFTVLFFPPLCTALVSILGASWIVLRIGTVIGLVMPVAVGGAVALAVERLKPTWWARLPLSALVVAMALYQNWDRGEYSWRVYRDKFRLAPEKRGAWLARLQERSAFYAENIPRGSVILAHPRAGRSMVMLHDCHILVPDRAVGVGPTNRERRLDLSQLLYADLPWPVRKALLAKYGIDRVLVSGHIVRQLEWVRGHVRGQFKGPGVSILVLDME